MYLESHGENIEDDLLECWKILRKSPKWDQHCEDKAREAEAKKRSKHDDSQSDDDDEDSGKRPIGNKRAKSALANANIIEENRRADLELQKRHADLALKRYELLKETSEREAKRDAILKVKSERDARKEEREVMSINLTNLAPNQRQYFEILQQEILEKKLAERRAKAAVVVEEEVGCPVVDALDEQEEEEEIVAVDEEE